MSNPRTDSVNAESFLASGWKLEAFTEFQGLPTRLVSPDGVVTIEETEHKALLAESLTKFGSIWRELAKR
jgi:hypothetical protein